MKRSEQMIAEALRRAKKRDGRPVRVRLSRDLLTLVERCARSVGDSVLDWSDLACRRYESGALFGVSCDEKLKNATRSESVVAWVRAPHRMEPERIREALAAAVTRVAPNLPPSCNLRLREGIDYNVRSPMRLMALLSVAHTRKGKKQA